MLLPLAPRVLPWRQLLTQSHRLLPPPPLLLLLLLLRVVWHSQAWTFRLLLGLLVGRPQGLLPLLPRAVSSSYPSGDGRQARQVQEPRTPAPLAWPRLLLLLLLLLLVLLCLLLILLRRRLHRERCLHSSCHCSWVLLHYLPQRRGQLLASSCHWHWLGDSPCEHWHLSDG